MPRKKLYTEEGVTAFSIRLPESLRLRVDKHAQENRRSLNQEIVWLVQKALDLLDQEQASKEKQSSD